MHAQYFLTKFEIQETLSKKSDETYRLLLILIKSISNKGGKIFACQIQLGSFGHFKGSTKNIDCIKTLKFNSKNQKYIQIEVQ